MTDWQYQIALTIFFVSCESEHLSAQLVTMASKLTVHLCGIDVAVEVPSNLALKILKPPLWISINMILWGVCATCLGAVKTAGQLQAVRFLLGLFEGGLFPGLNFVL